MYAAIGALTDAGIETARQLITGTKITNLEYDRITEAGIMGGIVGGGSTIVGAALEGLARTRVVKSAVAKFTGTVKKGAKALKSEFMRMAADNRGYVNLDAFKRNSVTESVEELAESGKYFKDFDDLATYRRKQGMPVAGSVEDKHTAAKLIIGDDVYYGRNGHGKQNEVMSAFTVNPQTATHAEGDVFFQAKMAGKTNTKAVLVTDRCACRACGFNGGIRSLAKQMGITDLTVVSPGHASINFNPQVKPNPNPFK